MRYRITHRTVYSYETPAYESFNEIRVSPVSNEDQNCLDFSLQIDPPASVISFSDYYGNTVHDFGVPYLHSRLTIEATSEVVTFAGIDEPLSGPGIEGTDRSPVLIDLVIDPNFADLHAEFLMPSTYISLESVSGELAAELLASNPDATAFGYFSAAAAKVHAMLAYRIGTTTVHSTVSDVLAGGSGVCQDFAHVMISLCRHVGLPARYVSGYLGNISVSDASHAWAEAFIPPYGWVGVDATAGSPCTGRHVKVAVGRDYADVAVVRGTYRGGAASSLEVAVSAEIISDTQGMAMASGRRRGELIHYQTMGALKQRQRLGVLSAAIAAMSEPVRQRITREFDALPAHEEYGDRVAPRQQPQQQQQSGS